jgi:hypothetical protein
MSEVVCRPFGVLEAAWDEGSHLSVKPLSDVLSRLYTGKFDQYEYERFVGKHSFDEVHRYLCTRSSVKYIYVAAHGTEEPLIYAARTAGKSRRR